MKATTPRYLGKIPPAEQDGLSQLTDGGAYVTVKQSDLIAQ